VSPKIDSLNLNPAAARGAGAVSAPAGGSGRERDEAAAVPAADRVELTSTAQSLQRMEQALRGGEAYDAGRVEQVRAAMAAGTYKIDADAVAGSLIELERMLGRG